MAYRIVKITKPSEVHVTNHQLICEQEEVKFSIPLEDIEIIICIGAKIRFSTMGLGEITQAGIIVVGFGKKHETQTLIEPCRAMIDGKIIYYDGKFNLPFSEEEIYSSTQKIADLLKKK